MELLFQMVKWLQRLDYSHSAKVWNFSWYISNRDIMFEDTFSDTSNILLFL